MADIRPLLCIPTYSGKVPYELLGTIFNGIQDYAALKMNMQGTSFLTLKFNMYWCEALNNKEYTHFIILHDDLIPRDEHWLKKLVELADANNVDILSAVSPIKNAMGVTSTALAKKGEFGNFRRVTMRELGDLPEVFFRNDVAKLFGWEPKGHLLTNTGLMCVRMEKRNVLEKMRFTMQDWIKRTSDGKFYAQSEPEDWNWSREAQERGLTVAATRAIALTHRGEFDYRNDVPWGSTLHDDGDKRP